jgi:hypothetical protein
MSVQQAMLYLVLGLEEHSLVRLLTYRFEPMRKLIMKSATTGTRASMPWGSSQPLSELCSSGACSTVDRRIRSVTLGVQEVLLGGQV